MKQQLRIYLAWQRIADGRVQIRRWSPDRFANAAQNKYMFLGFEAQSSQATAWLAANGEPTYPDCFHADLPDEPYVIRDDSGEYKAWEPKAFAHQTMDDNNAGVMRILKLAKGE